MNKTELKLISELSQSMEIVLPAKLSLSELKKVLADEINHLVQSHFEKLVRILYKMDISEKVLKQNLQVQKENAGMIIAEMIIERQLQKIRSREQFKSNDDIAEDEKW